MDQLRNVLATIRSQLGELTPTLKLLIGSAMVIAIMVIFLITQYAGRPQLVELLPGVPAQEQQRAASILRAANYDLKDVNGRLMVKPGVQVAALATLQEQGQLPGDTALLFRNLIEKQSWQNSRTQNEQMFQIALQNELGHVIANFRGIRSATVLMDAPQAQGLGAAVRRPTASVTVFTDDGRALDQSTVDAIATLISGAKAGLAVEHVRVIDGSTGRQRVPTSSDQILPTHYREQAAATEEQKRHQIMELLSYIPGVVVAVTAEVDITQRRAQETSYKSADEGGTVSLLARETKNSVTESPGMQSAEPGLRSNQTLDIARGPSGGAGKSEQKDTQTEMENKVGSKVEQIVDPRGMPTRLAASVNIPQGYIEGLVRRAKEGASGAGGAGGTAGTAAAVTQTEIDDRFQTIALGVRESLLPHLKTQGVEGEVRVSLVPIDMPLSLPGASQAGMFGGGGLLAIGGGGLIEKGVLALLAMVAVGMMVAMVRRGGKQVKLPTPQEIIGIPPTLDTGSSVVGEADEIETAMAGIEVEEGSVRVQKMLEQLTEIVESDPAGTTKILNRWLQTDR